MKYSMHVSNDSGKAGNVGPGPCVARVDNMKRVNLFLRHVIFSARLGTRVP